MYFFEREYVCPKCGAKKMFYVYGRTDASEKFAVFLRRISLQKVGAKLMIKS